MAGEDDERLQRFLDADPGAKIAYEKRIEKAKQAIMQVADAKVALAEQAVLGACEVLIANGRLRLPAPTLDKADLQRAFNVSHDLLRGIREGTEESRARDVILTYLGWQTQPVQRHAALVQGR
ncbi:g900 [Coccomyxa elongata]